MSIHTQPPAVSNAAREVYCSAINIWMATHKSGLSMKEKVDTAGKKTWQKTQNTKNAHCKTNMRNFPATRPQFSNPPQSPGSGRYFASSHPMWMNEELSCDAQFWINFIKISSQNKLLLLLPLPTPPNKQHSGNLHTKTLGKVCLVGLYRLFETITALDSSSFELGNRGLWLC